MGCRATNTWGHERQSSFWDETIKTRKSATAYDKVNPYFQSHIAKSQTAPSRVIPYGHAILVALQSFIVEIAEHTTWLKKVTARLDSRFNEAMNPYMCSA